MADYMKKAAKSAAEYNIHFQRERREERKAYFDLQTFVRKQFSCHSTYWIIRYMQLVLGSITEMIILFPLCISQPVLLLFVLYFIDLEHF